MGIRPQKIQITKSQKAQDVLEQTEMSHQDVRKEAMEFYIKYKASYDKKANASKLKEKDFVYVLQPKADHQRSKIPFNEFRWIGTYIGEKALPKNNYLDCQIGRDKIQVLQRMRLLKYRLQQPILDAHIMPRERKCDPEVTITRDDFYARAGECENEKPVFDNDYDNSPTPNSSEKAVLSESTPEETYNIPGTIRGSSP